MNVKLIERSTVHLAQLFGLVKALRPVQIQGSKPCWGILVEGRGFTRLLAQEIPEDAPTVWRPRGWDMPRPGLFKTPARAIQHLQRIGLSGSKLWVAIDPG